MRSAEPLGHGALLAGLWSAARAGRLAHAFGFFGPAGSGKFLAAERLALGLLCAAGPAAPCLACGACRRALAGSHPDLLVLDPLEAGLEELPLSWITPREEPEKEKRPPGGMALEEFLALRPLEGGWRVVLVRAADLMKVYAQNALLKTLEEPGEDVLIVLESAHPEKLLATVRSRLLAVRCAPLEPAEVRAVLAARGVEPAAVPELTRIARGAPGRALEIARCGGLELRALLADVLAGRADPLAAAAAIGEFDAEWPGATPRAQARARARFVLDLAIELVAEVQRARAGVAEERWVHVAAARAALLPEARVEAALERLFEARQDVDLNLDPAACVERALLALAPRPSTPAARTP
ncbi:MAG: hypothetical protein JNK02_01420 [Planctomycetes bacterium]|nr:hypothetical protein [Planctomycetota bacterium]